MDNTKTMRKLLNKYTSKASGNLISKFVTKDKISKETGFYETLVIKKKPINKEQPPNKTNEVCKKVGNVNSLMKKKYMIPSQFPNITQPHELKENTK